MPIDVKLFSVRLETRIIKLFLQKYIYIIKFDNHISHAIILLVKKNIFLVLTVLGLIFPYYFIFQFYITENSPTLPAIMNLFATNMSAAFNADLFMSVLTSWTFMFFEGKRINMKNWWIFLPATLIGLSFALPLFFYFREKHLEETK